jgi:radical SAM superfamily enzyme YgiQ (UPF0313 family)
MMGKANSLAPLSLALLAAMTPEHYRMCILDEDIAPINPNELQTRLVAMKVLDTTAERAWLLADAFRARGIPVILGGPHITQNTVTMNLEHADSVVIGEGESVWSQVLADFEAGQLKKAYQPDCLIPYNDAVIPRWDLCDMEAYLSLPVQASRGCPYDCEFCNVPINFGRKMRFRSVENIIQEVASLPVKRVFFVDDNIAINKKFAFELMAGLKGMGIAWFCQTSIEVSEQPELLRAMAEAGCENILIGFESLSTLTLDKISKHHNTKFDYKTAISKIHAAGIHVHGSFIMGFDNDTLLDFDRLHTFALDAGLSFLSVSFLGCPSGSRMESRMIEEGRVWNVPRDLNGGLLPAVKHPVLKPLEMYDQYVDTLSKVYDFETVYHKIDILFADKAFARPKKDLDVKASEKLRLSMMMIKEFVFSSNTWKRRCFTKVFKLIREKKVDPQRIIIYLLSMLGYSKAMERLRLTRNQIKAVIQGYTEGM